MGENVETPEKEDTWGRHGRPFAASQTEHEWRLEVLVLLRGIFECVASAPWMQAVTEEPSVSHAPAAAFHEFPVKAEQPLPTWILTDEQVARVEGAVESEQRVRGRAYGG
jgi:hypothetical protein